MNETIAVAHAHVGANMTISFMISFTTPVQLQKVKIINLYNTNDDGLLYEGSSFSYRSYIGPYNSNSTNCNEIGKLGYTLNGFFLHCEW